MNTSSEDNEKSLNEEPEYKPSVINAQTINSALRSAQILIFIGFLLDGICGLYLYNLLRRDNAGPIQIILFGAAIIIGTALLTKGILRTFSVKAIGKYVSILRASERTDIAELSRNVRKSEQKVIRELENIFKRKYLHGSLDKQTHSITLVKK